MNRDLGRFLGLIGFVLSEPELNELLEFMDFMEFAYRFKILIIP
jgi:hypothetical protein